MPDTVHLYVFDGYADWEPAYALAALHHPQSTALPQRWQVRTVGVLRGSVVRSMGGLGVVVDLSLDQLRTADSALFVLPGGSDWEHEGAAGHTWAVNKAGDFLDQGVPVAAICGATAGLARAGLLDDRPHTSNALAYLRGTGYSGDAHYQDEAVVNDRGLITAGGMAALEFAHAVLGQLEAMDPDALEAWYQLYKTGQSAWFARLKRAALAAGTAA